MIQWFNNQIILKWFNDWKIHSNKQLLFCPSIYRRGSAIFCISPGARSQCGFPSYFWGSNYFLEATADNKTNAVHIFALFSPLAGGDMLIQVIMISMSSTSTVTCAFTPMITLLTPSLSKSRFQWTSTFVLPHIPFLLSASMLGDPTHFHTAFLVHSFIGHASSWTLIQHIWKDLLIS